MALGVANDGGQAEVAEDQDVGLGGLHGEKVVAADGTK